jgi:Tfp pilus assembly protein PilX
MALITSILVLLVVTVLGLSAMQIGSTEGIVSGSFRSSEDAFYAADGGLSWVRTAFTYFNATTQTFPTGGDVVPVSASGTIQPNGTGPPPVGKGLSAVYFGSQYYQITSVGTAPSNTQSRIQARVSQVTPK